MPAHPAADPVAPGIKGAILRFRTPPVPVTLAMLAFTWHARATASAPLVGFGGQAQPAIVAVGVAEPAPTSHLVLASTLGYGWTEAQSAADGAHHRASGRVALGFWPTRFWSFTAVSNTRYDRHPIDDHGRDDGWTFDGSLGTRLVKSIGALRLGGQLDLWIPSADRAKQSFEAVTPELRALIAWQFDSVLVGSVLGYRFDRSADATRSLDSYRIGDRISLGLSEFDAVLLGIGIKYRIATTELLAEYTGDLLVGKQSPALGLSPMRATLGVRQQLSRPLTGELSLTVVPSARPEVVTEAPLFPMEPRIGILAGLRYWFDVAVPRDSSVVLAPRPAMSVIAAAPGPSPLAESSARPVETRLGIRLDDERGAPLINAIVRLATRDQTYELPAKEPGIYELLTAPVGRARLEILAEGKKPIAFEVNLEPGVPLELTLHAETALPSGQVRGLLRTYAGSGVAARIRVEPLGLRASSDASGAFQIDVPPGNYEIIIEADGFHSQRRKVSVEKDGVVILNAELNRGR